MTVSKWPKKFRCGVTKKFPVAVFDGVVLQKLSVAMWCGVETAPGPSVFSNSGLDFYQNLFLLTLLFYQYDILNGPVAFTSLMNFYARNGVESKIGSISKTLANFFFAVNYLSSVNYGINIWIDIKIKIGIEFGIQIRVKIGIKMKIN